MRQQKLEEENKRLQDCIKQLIESYNKIRNDYDATPDENEIRDDTSKLDGE